MPARTAPAATAVLIGINVALFLWAGWWDGAAAGVLEPPATRPASLLAAIIVHGSPVRLTADLLCLWLFGENLEDRTGHLRFAAFYGVCASAAIAGSLAFPAASLLSGTGVSGAAAGVIAAHLALFPQSRILLLIPLPPAWMAEVPAAAIAAAWLAVHLAFGVLPVLDGTQASTWNTGVPGLVIAMIAGAAFIRAFARRERMRPEWWHDGARATARDRDKGSGIRDRG